MENSNVHRFRYMYDVSLHWKYHPPGDRRPYYAECRVYVLADDENIAREYAVRTLDLENVTEVYAVVSPATIRSTSAVRSKKEYRSDHATCMDFMLPEEGAA